MRQFPQLKPDTSLLRSKQEKWKTLNTLVSSSQIKPNELAEAVDIQLIEDGKIQCPRDGQAYYGEEDGSRVTGLFPYYNSDGTSKLLRMSGTHLQVLDESNLTWSNVIGATYTDSLNANGVVAYDNLYLCNGTDNLTYYNGTSITAFTAVTAPSAPTVTRTGTTGSYTYSYKITAVTSVGETEASTAGTQVANVNTLDSSTYMTVSWSAVTNATGYNVYGRKDGFWYFMKYLEGNASTSYVDKGQDTPQDSFTPPEGNTTGGARGKYISVYKDSLFLYGDPDNPSRLYYSAGGDRISDFSVSSGGGFIDVSKNDGQKGTGLIVFKNSLLVFKEGSIYQFSFNTSGLPQLTQVTPAVGCNAPRSIVAVENDIFFASDRGIFTIGNEAGFAFDVLRTNELSSVIRPVYKTIDPAYLENMAAIYINDASKNLVVFAYTPLGSTTNSKAIIYDRERLGWYTWTNIQANCFATYKDISKTTRFIYGDDSSGYVKELATGSNDFGTSIAGRFRLKSESFSNAQYGLDTYKRLKDLSVVLRQPIGTITMKVITDGTTTALTANIGTLNPSINWGHYLVGRFLLGVSYGTGSITSGDDLVTRRKKNVNLTGKTFMLEFSNSGSGSFTLLMAKMIAKPKSERYTKSEELIS